MVKGEKFMKEKNEMMKSLAEQGADLVTTEENGTVCFLALFELFF